MDGPTDQPTDQPTDRPTTRLLELLRASKKRILSICGDKEYMDFYNLKKYMGIDNVKEYMVILPKKNTIKIIRSAIYGDKIDPVYCATNRTAMFAQYVLNIHSLSSMK